MSVHTSPDRMQPISAEAVMRVVRALYVQLHPAHSEPRALTLHSRLDADLGLDSLARIELLQRLEQQFQLALPEATFTAAQTVADLLQALRSATQMPATPVVLTDVERAAAPPAAVTMGRRSPGRPTPEATPTVLEPMHARTLQEVLLWRAEHDPSATHLILLDGSASLPLTYRELAERATRVARGLQQHAIGAGSSVALMLPTTLDFFPAFFGVLLAGAIPVPIYPPAGAAQLEEHVRRHTQILTNANAGALITAPEISMVARVLQAHVGTLQSVFSVAELAGTVAPQAALPPSSADAIALLQYTSGSTGSPKGVMLTHEQLLANIRAMGQQVGADATDVFVSWLPLYHDMGLIGAWLGSLYFGCLLVIMPPTAFLAHPARWLRTIHDYRATLSASPNFGYELAARRIAEAELEGLDLSCWRTAFNGAEPVAPETVERFQRRFASHGFRPQAMTPVYGLAEAAVGLTFPPPLRGPLVDCVDRLQLTRTGRALPTSPLAPSALRFVSCGLPLRRYQVRIVDTSGSELPERTEGELQFAGPSATDGYYRNPGATARLKRGSWRESGDRGYLANGELFITGRSKDIIIRRGRHIYPEEIERAVGELAGVRRGCVVAFGSTAPDTGTERLIVVAETYPLDPPQQALLRASITAAVVERVGEPPDEVLFTAPHSVLKTSSGKLRRAATREAYEDGSLSHPRASPLHQLWRLALGSLLPSLRRGARSAARRAYGLYAWTALVAVAAPIIALTALGLNHRRAWLLTHRAASLLVRLWRIPLAVQWEEPIDLSASHVIVANHCSYVDSLFLALLLPSPHCFVARFQFQNLPVLHGYFRRLGTLFFQRSGARDSTAELQQLKAVLARGQSLAVFPEGTFTRAAGLQSFHLGAFAAAAAAAVPVIPVALRGTRSMLRDGQALPRRVPVSIVVGRPLRPCAGVDLFATAVSLREAARAHVLRHCGEPDVSE